MKLCFRRSACEAIVSAAGLAVCMYVCVAGLHDESITHA